MPSFVCPHCRKSVTATLPTTATQMRCPHCQRAVAVPAAKTAKEDAPASRPFPWLVAALAGSAACALLACCIVGAVVFFKTRTPADVKHVDADRKKVNDKTQDADKPNNDVVQPKDDDRTKPIIEKKPIGPERSKNIDEFVALLNRHRKAAGLGLVTLDADLSRGCQAHAEYLGINFDAARPESSKADEEKPGRNGYSVEGERAASNSIVTLQEPLAALDRWMARMPSRVPLLHPEMQSIGVGAIKNERGAWFCVADIQRGRGEAIVVYPAANQTEVPISFSGGTDVPDPKLPAGFPITVSFGPKIQVANAQIALHDEKSNSIDGWLWTPDKLPRPGQKLNAIGFVPKKLLNANAVYKVKASAQLDDKPWSLTWSFTTDDDSDRNGAWAKKAVEKVNAYRNAAGLKPVVLDEKLSAGCLKHARYLVINEGHPSLLGLKAHEEDEKLPGYSKVGHESGKASDIGIGDYEPIDAVDAWMGTLYHRAPILAPNLKAVGFASVRGRRQGWATVMNVQNGRDKSASHAVFYPQADQIDVPLAFPNSGEEPNPIPDDKDSRAGYPITAFFPPNETIKNATGKLTIGKDVEIPCWFSSPEKPANAQHVKAQGNAVCLIAMDPLTPKRTYQVHLKGTLAGKAWEKKWKFTTRDAGFLPPTKMAA